MPTEVLDGNQVTTQPAPATVDAQAFAQAMARELASSLNQNQNATPKQQADEIGEVVAALRQSGLEDSDIQAHISTALGVAKKAERQTQEEIKKAAGQYVADRNNRELSSAIGRAVRSYTKDDELLQEVSEAIRNHVRNEFLNGSSASVLTARSKFINGGELDEDIIDDIAAKKIEAIEKKRSGKKGAATPTITPSDVTRPNADADKSAVTSPEDDMSEIQRTVYQASLSQFKRTMTSEEAQKQALVAANRVKK